MTLYRIVVGGIHSNDLGLFFLWVHHCLGSISCEENVSCALR